MEDKQIKQTSVRYFKDDLDKISELAGQLNTPSAEVVSVCLSFTTDNSFYFMSMRVIRKKLEYTFFYLLAALISGETSFAFISILF